MHGPMNVKRVFPSVSHFLLSVTKVKSFLCCDRKPYGGSGGEKSALCPGYFTSGERVPVPWMGGQLGPRAVGGTKISFLHQKLYLYSSVVEHLPLTLYRLGCPQHMSEGIRCRTFILFISVRQYLYII
jgi:hypothetical protein